MFGEPQGLLTITSDVGVIRQKIEHLPYHTQNGFGATEAISETIARCRQLRQ